MIPIYVGTDQRQGIAERVLERSVRDHTDREVEFRWMRAGDPGYPERTPLTGNQATAFTLFRFCVPELMGFEGKAIYLDSDMLVLGDIGDLYDLNDGSAAYLTYKYNRTEVAVIQADHFKSKKWWPSMAKILEGDQGLRHYTRLLKEHGFIVPGIHSDWNTMDNLTSSTKLLHFTRMETQPWKPWPEAMEYRRHPDQRCLDLWNEYQAKVEALGTDQFSL